MEQDVEKIVSLFKEANQSLRKRAISIGLLMIIAIGLKINEDNRYENVLDLLSYQGKLKEIKELPDSTFKIVISGNTEKYFPIGSFNNYDYEHSRLFEKIKNNNYSRNLIEQAVDDIDKRMDQLNAAQSIGILGVSIPIGAIIYMSIFIVLILFHDFTQTIIYRNQIYKRIRKSHVPDWKLGFEFFGFYNKTNNASIKFLKFTSSIIAGVLVLSPIITCAMIAGISSSNSEFNNVLNIFCFTLILIDTTIIFFAENFWNFRYFSNRYLGKHNLSIVKMRIIWIYPIVLLGAFYLMIAMEMLSDSILINILYFLLALLPLFPLWYYLENTYKNPSEINRGIRAGLLVLNAFWIYTIINFSFHNFEWDYDRIETLSSILFISIIISMASAYIYVKYFMSPKRIDL